MNRLLDALARRRRTVLVVLAIVTLGLASQIGELEAVFAPEELVPPRPEEAARLERLLGAFPDREEPVVVMIRAGDVLERLPLAYAHRVARHFAGAPWVSRVEGLTTTPMPRPSRAQDEGVTLDSLEDEPLDPIDGPLARLAATDPERFPMGLLSVAERTGGVLELGPLIEGDRVSAGDVARVRLAVEGTPSVRGRAIDEAGELLAIAIVPRVRGAELEREVRRARAWLEANAPPEGVEVRLGGMPAVRAAMVDALRDDQWTLVTLAILGSLVVLVLGFRSWAGVLLPLGAAGMTSGMVVGAMALIGEPINLLNNVVPPLLITIGLGDAIHLLVRHGEELRRDPDPTRAAQRTMRAIAGACFVTSATTAVGFGSLVASETEVMRRFAITAALGVMLAYVVTILFLPAALPDFRIPRRRGALERLRLERLVTRTAATAARHAALVVGLAVAALLGSLALAGSVRVDSALLEQLDPSSEDARTARLIEQRLGGVRTLEIALAGDRGRYESAAGARELDALERWLRKQPGVLRVTSVTEPLRAVWAHLAGVDTGALATDARARALAELGRHAAPSLLARFVSEDGARARIEVRLADRGERHLNALLDRLEARLDRMPVEAAVGGEAQRSARGLGRLVRDLIVSLAMAVLIIFTMLGILFRSLRLALISVLPNVLPLALTVAYMAARGIPLHAGTAIVFTVSIGLVVDGTIHVLARHREETFAGRRRGHALLRAMRGSGRAVVLGAATLLLGFSALSFASFVPIRWFAELSMVAIATALIADLIVLPALLALFGAPMPPRSAPSAATQP